MDAYTFRRTDSYRDQAVHKGGRPKRCAINFCDRYIKLSTQLAEKLNLSNGSHVAFTYDEKKPECIFIRPADYPDDTRDIQLPLSSSGRNNIILRCYNKAVVQYVLRYAEAKHSCTCYVAQKPTCINGKDHYQILLSCPIMIN